MKTIELTLNGTKRTVSAEPGRSLLSVLRDELDLCGSKYGCGEGQCGACTVLIEGQAARSCVTSISDLAGKRVITIEGLEKDGRLHPLQEAFIQAGAFQCGYCTPGMIMSAVALLAKTPNPAEQEIIRSMQGNICRCGTYPRILTAIRNAARGLKGGAK
jgi:aerobic-type carbon monoxide dehydrogenase small subunit (CoxS/CutS family)